MDEDTIGDLKQFIAATVEQYLANVATKDDVKKLSTGLNELGVKVDAIQSAINDSVIPFVDHIDEQVQKHEKRITKLEHAT